VKLRKWPAEERQLSGIMKLGVYVPNWSWGAKPPKTAWKWGFLLYWAHLRTFCVPKCGPFCGPNRLVVRRRLLVSLNIMWFAERLARSIFSETYGLPWSFPWKNMKKGLWKHRRASSFGRLLFVQIRAINSMSEWRNGRAIISTS